MNKQGIKRFLYRIFCGFLLGVSVVGPGVSGSVMAVMLGIYSDLIAIAANPFKKLKKNIIYLIPLGIGAAISFVLSIFLLNALFEHHETPAFILFIALIIGSVPTIWNSARKPGDKILLKHIIVFVIAMAISVVMGVIKQNEVVLGANTSIIYLSFVGFIAGATAVIPGMSVSLILMLFGAYKVLMGAAETSIWQILTVLGFGQTPLMDAGIHGIWIMLPVGLCFVAGLIVLSRGIKHVFEHHETIGYFTVLGFVLGSLYGIIPSVPKDAAEWGLSALMLAVGISLSILFVYLGKKLNIDESLKDAVDGLEK